MGRRGIEFEVKFAPAGEATLTDLAARAEFPGWTVVRRHDERQRNTYYETPSAALEAARCSLRRRVLDHGVEWTFKRGAGPGRDGVARRREANALLPLGSPDLPKCEPVRRARKVADREPLQPLFTLLTARQQIELAPADDPTTRLALALDRVRLDDARVYHGYEEAEVEIELLDGDERAVAQLAIWLMQTYGLLPLRGSKRGRALAWLRGTGLPVVAPALGLRLLAERVAALAPQVHGRPVVVALAAPRGSDEASRLARALHEQLPSSRLLTGVTDSLPFPHEVLLPSKALPQLEIVIIEGPDILKTRHADIGAWVKVSLPQPLLARLLVDASAAGRDAWEILRRCGEYAVPLQRRYLDPAAQWADLVVINNAPPEDDPAWFGAPAEQIKLFGWPAAATLDCLGAVAGDHDLEDDRFFTPPGSCQGELLRVRLCADTAWVSFPRDDSNGRPTIVTYEARPRVLALLPSLGYTAAGQVRKARRRYRTGGWEIALDLVAGLGYCGELRRVGSDERDQEALIAALGLSGARTTTAPYRDLVLEAREALARLPAPAKEPAGMVLG